VVFSETGTEKETSTVALVREGRDFWGREPHAPSSDLEGVVKVGGGGGGGKKRRPPS